MATNNVYAGELTSRIVVEVPDTQKNGRGGKTVTWKPLFGERVSLPAKWRTTVRVADTVDHDHVAAVESATVTIRNNKRVGAVCRIRRIGDTGEPWDVVAAPVPSPNRMWLEFTVQRKAAAL